MKIMNLIILTMFLSVVYGQENKKIDIREFKGLWELSIDSEENTTEKIYFLIGNKSMIELYNDFKYDRVYSLFGPSEIGFVNKDSINSISIVNYKKCGSLEEDYLVLGNNFECTLPEYEGGEITQMVLYNMNEFYYYRLSIIPTEIQKALYKELEENNKDYLLDFLNIDIREITSKIAYTYNDKKGKTDIYLVKGDIVEIESIDEEFAKVTYNKNDEKLIKGYVRYSDISKKSPIPSFDPKRAATPIEKAICSDVILASLDRQLAAAYKEAKTKHGDEVKNEQLVWIKKRNIACQNKSQEELIGLLKDLYVERLTALNKGLK